MITNSLSLALDDVFIIEFGKRARAQRALSAIEFTDMRTFNSIYFLIVTGKLVKYTHVLVMAAKMSEVQILSLVSCC
jgi:hypothetical protein